MNSNTLFQVQYKDKRIRFYLGPFGYDCGTFTLFNVDVSNADYFLPVEIDEEISQFFIDVLVAICGIRGTIWDGSISETRKVIAGCNKGNMWHTYRILHGRKESQEIITPSAHNKESKYVYTVVTLPDLPNTELNVDIRSEDIRSGEVRDLKIVEGVLIG